MQERDGSMKVLDVVQFEKLNPVQLDKTIQDGQYFKIKHCYFKIADIDGTGFKAVGVSRKEYFDSKRN